MLFQADLQALLARVNKLFWSTPAAENAAAKVGDFHGLAFDCAQKMRDLGLAHSHGLQVAV